MSRLNKVHSLWNSTVFRYGLLVDISAGVLAYLDKIDGPTVMNAIILTFTTYAAKEGVAYASEAYRDKQ